MCLLNNRPLRRCVEAEGIDYHPHCLACTLCNASLTKGYIIRQGKRFCSNCDDKLDSTEWQCNKCGFQNADTSVACAVCRTEQTWTEDSPLVAVLSGNTPAKESPKAGAGGAGQFAGDGDLLDYHHDAVETLLERNPLGHSRLATLASPSPLNFVLNGCGCGWLTASSVFSQQAPRGAWTGGGREATAADGTLATAPAVARRPLLLLRSEPSACFAWLAFVSFLFRFASFCQN
jgi:hypothetical protein